jgi:hypothetical protein
MEDTEEHRDKTDDDTSVGTKSGPRNYRHKSIIHIPASNPFEIEGFTEDLKESSTSLAEDKIKGLLRNALDHFCCLMRQEKNKECKAPENEVLSLLKLNQSHSLWRWYQQQRSKDFTSLKTTTEKLLEGSAKLSVDPSAEMQPGSAAFDADRHRMFGLVPRSSAMRARCQAVYQYFFAGQRTGVSGCHGTDCWTGPSHAADAALRSSLDSLEHLALTMVMLPGC